MGADARLARRLFRSPRATVVPAASANAAGLPAAHAVAWANRPNQVFDWIAMLPAASTGRALSADVGAFATKAVTLPSGARLVGR